MVDRGLKMIWTMYCLYIDMVDHGVKTVKAKLNSKCLLNSMPHRSEGKCQRLVTLSLQ